MAPWLVFIVQRMATVPLLGLGALGIGTAVGSYSLSRSGCWIFIGNAEWDKDPKNRRAGLAAGIVSGGAIAVLREFFFRPKMVVLPGPGETATILEHLSHSLQSMGHTVQNYPYRFRALTLLTAGAVGGVVSVFAQKEYATGSARAAVLRTSLPSLSSAPSGREAPTLALGQPQASSAPPALPPKVTAVVVSTPAAAPVAPPPQPAPRPSSSTSVEDVPVPSVTDVPRSAPEDSGPLYSYPVEVPIISVVAPTEGGGSLEGPGSFDLAGDRFISFKPAPEEPGSTVLDRITVSAAEIAAATAASSSKPRLYAASAPVFGDPVGLKGEDGPDDAGLDLPAIRLDIHSKVVDALLRR